MLEFQKRWKSFLLEAAKDAKILRNINIDFIKKEEPINPEEEIRDYIARVQQMERDPEYPNPVFPQGLVSWMESLPDNHFPTNGRKRFAKWLGNAVYYQETEIQGRINSVDSPEELSIYNNDVRYIADYLNGADDFPKDLWDKSLNGMYDLAVEWHDTLKYKEDPTGDYQNKDIVYKFDNGYTIVDVNTENDLEVEGEKMGHCVGSYCDHVASGQTVIYSLRDKRNEPHATIEVLPPAHVYRDSPPTPPKVDQIKGKGNAAPVEKYRPMLKQWLQTTEFSYESSPDYLNILSADEIKEKLFSGELGKDSEQSLARTSDDPEIIQFFLDQITAAGSDHGGSSADLVTKLNPSSITDYILRNDNLNEEHRLSLIRINFKLRKPALGVRMSQLLGAMGHSGTRNFDPESLSSRVWEELGPELTRGYDDEKLYCMQALMELEESSDSIKEEIINHLLSDEYIEGAVKQRHQLYVYQQQPYGATLQAYLFQKSPSREQVKRLYTIQRDQNFTTVIGSVGRLNGYISSSRGMSDELADEIIEDVKAEKNYAFLGRNLIDMILNPRLSDSKKIELLNIGQLGISIISQTQPPVDRGLKYHISGKSYSRQLYEAAREKKFSKRLVKYMIDAGVFDPQYVNVWIGQRVKMTGSAPRIEKYDEDEKQKVLDIVRSRQLQEFESGLFDEELSEKVNNYFRKNVMTKEKFYDNIEKEITEEKGRSRQRGIYKFHCMIAYTLTSENEKTRGLDDILADLRALENVTIVTVVIRNQKIAEGRYIAGLAIKFIPSTPGNMGTPENTKARIVKDIKRINNVQSLFKLSAGLIRLE